MKNVAIATALLLTAAPSLAAGPSSHGDMFLTDAMKGDNSEVAAGRLAQERGASPAVRDYGAMLVRDHGGHKAKLAAMAGQHRIRATDDVTPEARRESAALMRLRGRAFDRAFARAMVEDHRKDIAKYEMESRARGDGNVARMASDTLPTLRHHLEMARKL